jgi:hypothetical protein
MERDKGAFVVDHLYVSGLSRFSPRPHTKALGTRLDESLTDCWQELCFHSGKQAVGCRSFLKIL